MKKLIVLFSAVAALAACSKNEVVPAVSGENMEISYKVAPRTKADPQTQEFGKTNVFASWAYYLPSGKSWANDYKDAKIYIGEEGGGPGATISYGNNVWKDQNTSYYWPKEGKLTFFAYSLNSDSLTDKFGTDTHFYCTKNDSQYGICGPLHMDKHPNTDLLVADIAADKTANETSYYKVNGVPTLFKHKLSRIQFAVKKKEEYKGATITLNSITFKKLVNYMFYNQYKINEDKSITPDYITYTILSQTPRSDQEYTKTDFVVSSYTSFDQVPHNNEIRYIYIPQDFKNADEIATIEVKFTVTFKDGISETYTKTLNVKDIFDSWEIGKRYTFNLIFSLDEIKWAPAVGDWEDVENTNGYEIKDPDKK